MNWDTGQVDFDLPGPAHVTKHDSEPPISKPEMYQQFNVHADWLNS